jgi:hypothetical protein
MRFKPYHPDRCRQPGYELFGLCSPFVQRIIQAIPGTEADLPTRTFRTKPVDYVKQGLLIAPIRAPGPDVFVIDFRPLLQMPCSGASGFLSIPTAELEEYLGRRITTPDDFLERQDRKLRFSYFEDFDPPDGPG